MSVATADFSILLAWTRSTKTLYSVKKKGLKQVWDENIWITTSGIFSMNPMATVPRNRPLEHIMYSVYYPFEENEKGLKFMEDLKESGLVNEEQIKAIAYKNAAKLLRINTPAV